MVEEAGVGHIVIDGRVSSEARKVSVDRFQTEDSVRVAVLSITAAAAGITLTAASLVVFAELYWNPGVLTQAEDRAHRIGQTQTVRQSVIRAIQSVRLLSVFLDLFSIKIKVSNSS